MLSSTLVMTPNGPTVIGSLRSGSDIYTVDGKHQKVIGVSSNNPQDIYKVVFEDGRYIYSSPAQNLHYRTNRKKWRTVTTKRLFHMFKRSPDYVAYAKLYCPWDRLCDVSEQMYDVIHPFNLGALIGDGALTQNTVKLHHYDLSIRDYFIKNSPACSKFNLNPTIKESNLDRLKGESGELAIYSGKITEKLKEWNLRGKRSWEKSIPMEILGWGNAPWRMELLRGLLATDGYFGESGGCVYSTVSEQLSRDVQDLARSLGCIVNVSCLSSHRTHDGERNKTRDRYLVNIRYKDYNELAFKPFHKNKINSVYREGFNSKIKIKSVEKLKHKLPTTLIKVSDPRGLFVCGEYTVVSGVNYPNKRYLL